MKSSDSAASERAFAVQQRGALWRVGGQKTLLFVSHRPTREFVLFTARTYGYSPVTNLPPEERRHSCRPAHAGQSWKSRRGTATKEIQAQLKRFGANVRREHTARGLTQERLAELADLNLRTVQKIEAGQLNILLTTLIRIQPRRLSRAGAP